MIYEIIYASNDKYTYDVVATTTTTTISRNDNKPLVNHLKSLRTQNAFFKVH